MRQLTILLVAFSLQAQPPGPAMAQDLDPGPSLVALPIQVNLEPIFQMVEKTAPKVPPGVETWTPLPDMGKGAACYRFNLYRDPLIFHVEGNRITVKAEAHYWLEVGVKAARLVKRMGGCGQGAEGFRRVCLGVQAELGLKPDWGLELKAVPLDPIALNPCKITFLSYDITDKVLAGMKENMIKATQSMEQMVRDSALLHQKAEVVWQQLQQPMEIAEGIFLMVNPERIRLAPWQSQGQQITITPEIQARPVLLLGAKPEAAPKPLPPLETAPTSLQPGFHVRVEADLGFEHATAQLKKQMVGKTFDTEKGSLQVLDAIVRGQEGKAILEITLKGKVNGKVVLQGRPEFNEQLGTLQLAELDYTLESKSWMIKFGEWLYRTTLKKTLAEKANWFMDKSLKDVKEMVQQGLNRPLLPGLNLKGNLDNLKLGQPRVLSDRFRLDAFLEGKAQVEVSGLPEMK